MKVKFNAMIGAVATAAMLMAGSAVYAAGSGYSPTPSPVPPGTPGGYSQVVTVVPLAPNKTTPTTIKVKVDGSGTQVTAPPHIFKKPLRFAVTAPKLNKINGSLKGLHYGNYKAIAGVGLAAVNPNGHPDTSYFPKWVTITISNKNIKPGDRIIGWNPNGKPFLVTHVVFKNGKAILTIKRNGAFAVLAPNK